MHPVEPIGGGHGSVTNPRREQPATLWTWWTTQARCPHAHSDNNKRRQPFEIGSKSPTRLHEETKTLEKYDDSISFVAEKLGGKGVADLERLATALYVTQR